MEAFRKFVEKVMSRTDDQQLDCALMASVQRQLTEVADAVARVRPLAGLPEPEKRECAKTSVIKRYPARSIVYDEDCDSGEANAYFVLEGRCICLQRLHVRRTTAIGSGGFALVTKRHDGEDKEQSVGRNVRTVYVKMSDLRPGSVFGLGERRSGRLVMATADVKCLLVPLTFLAKNNESNFWGRTVCSLNASNPNIEQSFRKFLVENKWEEYKKSLVDDLFGNAMSHDTTSIKKNKNK
ncbi:uncharacterized protein LOC112692424 [Sipha flava]|uniref:Uncharacterized protein LOC112692424 n=1 Tax=Sipha flava TaxID=143950 RepID=A0A2S2Q2V4_9HEMI|nr:uncharacterized protein LOC112692424 [Sipha flava]